MTTTEIPAVEDALEADAKALAATPSGIGTFEVDNAIRAYEKQGAERRDRDFRLSGEQRAALVQLSRGSLVAIEGLPGVGKTIIQGAVRTLGEQLGREVVGLTLSQAAAERLESEAGFCCVNTARARIATRPSFPRRVSSLWTRPRWSIPVPTPRFYSSPAHAAALFWRSATCGNSSRSTSERRFGSFARLP
jgi:hypothetical protein